MSDDLLPNQLARLEALEHYFSALEHGQGAALAQVLRAAESDPVLERLLLALHASIASDESVVSHPEDATLAQEAMRAAIEGSLRIAPPPQPPANNQASPMPLSSNGVSRNHWKVTQVTRGSRKMYEQGSQNNELDQFASELGRRKDSREILPDAPNRTMPMGRGSQRTPPNRALRFAQAALAVVIIVALVGGVIFALRHLGTNGHGQPNTGTRPTSDPQHVVIGSTEYGVVTAMDPASGAIRWSTNVQPGHPLQIEYIQSGIVIAVSYLGQVVSNNDTTIIYALNEQNGRIIWSQTIQGFPPLLYMDIGVLFFSYPNEAVAERAADGKTLWSVRNADVAAAAGGYVYIELNPASARLTEQKIDIATRAVVWSQVIHKAGGSLGGMLSGSIMYIVDEETQFQGEVLISQSTSVLELRASDGKVLTSFIPLASDLSNSLPVSEFGNSQSPSQQIAEGTIYYNLNSLCALGLPENKIRWCEPNSQQYSLGLNPVAALSGGTLYIGTKDLQSPTTSTTPGGASIGQNDIYNPDILAIDPANGALRWQWKGPKVADNVPQSFFDVYGGPLQLSIAVLQNRVFVATAGGVFAVDATTGKQLWRSAPKNLYYNMFAA